AVWDSTQDATSSTGGVTLKSILDPQNTGTKVVASAPVVHLQLTSSFFWRLIGNPIQLTWNAPALSQCTPTGGQSVHGWSGALGASGTLDVTENQPGDVTYELTCALPGGGSATTSVTVTWRLPDPQLTFSGPDFPFLWVTRPAALKWSSNLEPCEIAGGS